LFFTLNSTFNIGRVPTARVRVPTARVRVLLGLVRLEEEIRHPLKPLLLFNNKIV